jgi:hypothetical protein
LAFRQQVAARKGLLMPGVLDEDPAIVAPFGERQRLVNKPIYDELDARYKDAD